eukprot:7698684-Lingulodinium_polyedra.AAC.1
MIREVLAPLAHQRPIVGARCRHCEEANASPSMPIPMSVRSGGAQREHPNEQATETGRWRCESPPHPWAAPNQR